MQSNQMQVRTEQMQWFLIQNKLRTHLNHLKSKSTQHAEQLNASANRTNAVGFDTKQAADTIKPSEIEINTTCRVIKCKCEKNKCSGF